MQATKTLLGNIQRGWRVHQTMRVDPCGGRGKKRADEDCDGPQPERWPGGVTGGQGHTESTERAVLSESALRWWQRRKRVGMH